MMGKVSSRRGLPDEKYVDMRQLAEQERLKERLAERDKIRAGRRGRAGGRQSRDVSTTPWTDQPVLKKYKPNKPGKGY